MDFILTIIIIFLYVNGNKVIAIVGYIALLTNYFMMAPAHDLLFFKHDIQYSAVIFVIFVIVFEYSKEEKWLFVEPKIRNFLGLFFLYIISTSVYDVLANHTALIDVFKANKTWLYLLSFFIFSKLSLKELYQVVKIICFITLLHVFIYYIQYFTGIILVETKIINQYVGDSLAVRYGYSPYYSLLLILVLLSDLFRIKPVFKYFFIVLTLGTSILALTRSMTLSLIAGIFIYESFKNNNIIKYTFVVFLLLILVPIIFPSSLVYDRFFEGFNDVVGVYNNFNMLEKEGTFSYRILHVTERVLYISNNVITSLIGIGYVHELNFSLDPFEYGIFKEEYGEISQLGTADISWSGLFLRYGFLGVVLYLLFTGYFIKLFFSFKRYPVAKIGFTYIVVSFLLLSFSSARIAFGNFWPIVFLLFFTLQKTVLLNKQVSQNA